MRCERRRQIEQLSLPVLVAEGYVFGDIGVRYAVSLDAERHLGGAGQIKHLLDRVYVHQHVALFAAFGKQRRMQHDGPPAQPFRQLRGKMIDVGVVFSLHPAGQRHNGDVEGAVGFDVLHNGPYPLAAGNRNDIAIPDGFDQMRSRGTPDLAQSGAGAAGDGRCDNRIRQ